MKTAEEKYDYINYTGVMVEKNGLISMEADKIVKMLNAEKDHRSIDKSFLDDFCEKDGRLRAFLDKVIEVNNSAAIKDKLVVCFRGNEIIIYKNNHVLWDISRNSSGDYAVEFNYNHARYSKDWENILAGLCSKKIGYVTNSSDGEKEKVVDSSTGLKPQFREKTNLVTGGTIGTIRCVKNSFDKAFVDYTYSVLNELINSFMKDHEDYFREKIKELAKRPELNLKIATDIRESGSNPYIEKRWQQRFFHHFKDRCSGTPWIFVYDLEFSQRYPNDEIKKKLEANEPDMLAIEFDEQGTAKKLLFIEVKSTYSACLNEKTNNTTGLLEHKSDLWSHLKGMRAYCEMTYFVQSRIIDAQKLLKQYLKTGLYPILEEANIDSIADLTVDDVERVILLTNNSLPKEESKPKKKKLSALDFYKENDNRVKLEELIRSDDPECKVWITENDYYDESITITECRVNT